MKFKLKFRSSGKKKLGILKFQVAVNYYVFCLCFDLDIPCLQVEKNEKKKRERFL